MHRHHVDTALFQQPGLDYHPCTAKQPSTGGFTSVNIKPLAIVFMTHRWRPVDQARYARLCREIGGHGDCYLLMDDRTPRTAGDALPDNTHLFNVASLPERLGYPYLTAKGVVPGCTHYVVYDFATTHPYQKYLFVEHDVEYTGDWADIARDCLARDADLIAAHVHNHAQRPTWPWWNSLRGPDGRQAAVQQMRKAFFPLSCISRRALSFVHAAQRLGWTGHFEVLIPSLLTANGLRVCDWNDTLPRYHGSEQDPTVNAQTDSSTLRWRPGISLAEFTTRWRAATVYHPVKADWAWIDGQLHRFPAGTDNTATQINSPASASQRPEFEA